MSEPVKATLVGGVFLIAAAIFYGGIYSMTFVSHGDRIGAVYIINRLTGTTWMCQAGACEKTEGV